MRRKKHSLRDPQEKWARRAPLDHCHHWNTTTLNLILHDTTLGHCYAYYSQLALVFPGGGNRKHGNTTVWDYYVYCVLEHLVNTV